MIMTLVGLGGTEEGAVVVSKGAETYCLHSGFFFPGTQVWPGKTFLAGCPFLLGQKLRMDKMPGASASQESSKLLPTDLSKLPWEFVQNK